MGISPRTLLVLRTIVEIRREHNACTAREVGRLTKTDPGLMQRQFQALLAEGLVSWTRVPGSVTTTEKADGLIAAAALGDLEAREARERDLAIAAAEEEADRLAKIAVKKPAKKAAAKKPAKKAAAKKPAKKAAAKKKLAKKPSKGRATPKKKPASKASS